MPDAVADHQLIWVVAGAASFIAALLHVACIVIGGKMYRFMGAGDQMAELADAGHWYPTVITLGIAGILAGWGYYAFAAGDLVPRPPALVLCLCLITAVYTLRGVALIPVLARFAAGAQTVLIGRSGGGLRFWIVTSLICLGFGLIHGAALILSWRSL
jgi:hypothetical protein